MASGARNSFSHRFQLYGCGGLHDQLQALLPGVDLDHPTREHAPVPRRVADDEGLVLRPAQKPGREPISLTVLPAREDLPQLISGHCVLICGVPDRVDGLAVGSRGSRDVPFIFQAPLDLEATDSRLN